MVNTQPFRRANATVLLIGAAYSAVAHLKGSPLAYSAALREKLDEIGPYRSRGKGGKYRPRFARSHNTRAARSKYMPHQGARECDRRFLGGFYKFQRKNVASWA